MTKKKKIKKIQIECDAKYLKAEIALVKMAWNIEAAKKYLNG